MEEKDVNVVMYLRYSSEEQREESIKGQREINEKYCDRMGYTCIGEYVDRAISGLTDQRPGFQQMMAAAMNDPRFTKIIVYDLSRFSRHNEHLAKYGNMLRDINIDLESATEPFDNSPAGDLQRDVAQAVATYESKNLAKRVMRGLVSNAQMGDHTGGTPPYGYDLVEKKLVINPVQAEAVRMMFHMVDLGYSYSAIAETLFEKGYRSTSEDYLFKPTTILAMLKNEKYKGVYTFNKANRKNTQGKRTKHKKKREDEIIRTEDGCPAVVSEELFERVQEKLRSRRTSAKKSKDLYLFSDNDLLTCQNCGKKLRGNKKYAGRKKTEYRTYVCNNHRDKGCPTKDIQIKYIDDFVLGYIHELFFSEKMKPVLLNLLNSAEHTLADDDKQKIHTYKHEINLKNKALRRLLNQVTAGCSDSEITAQLKKLSNEKKVLERKVDRVKKGKKRRVFTEKDFDTLRQMFIEYLITNDTVATRMFMQDVVEDIIIGNDEITVTLNVA